MQKRILTLFVFFILLANFSYAVIGTSVLKSVSGNPNPAVENQTVEIQSSSVGYGSVGLRCGTVVSGGQFDSFEDGDFTVSPIWAVGGAAGTRTVETDNPLLGLYSLKIESLNAGGRNHIRSQDFNVDSAISFEVNYYVDQDGGIGKGVNNVKSRCFLIRGTDGNHLGIMDYNGSFGFVQSGDCGSDGQGRTEIDLDLTLDTWYKLEILYSQSASSFGIRIYGNDGKLLDQNESIPLAIPLTDIQYIDLLVNGTNVENITTYWDGFALNEDGNILLDAGNLICQSTAPFPSSNESCSFTNSFTEGTSERLYCQSFTPEIHGLTLSYFDLNTLIPLTDKLAITDITNISHTIQPFTVELNPADTAEDFVFKAENLTTSALQVDYNIFNSRDDGRQYKIYTASEGEYNDGIWNFQDTLTFGSTYYNSIQKIWDATNSRYNYIFTDTLIAEEITYYKLEYYEPAYHFNSTTDSADWDNAIAPNATDFNGTLIDIFQASYVADLASTLTNPKFPSITTGSANANYVFQLTGKADAVGSGELLMGSVPNLFGIIPSNSLDLSTSYTTFTVADIAGGYVKVESNVATSREIILHNYTVSERGFFTKSLEVFDSDGSELPVILDAGLVSQYILEGKDFIVDTEYFDPDGKIDRVEVSAYIDIVADANRMKRWVFDSEADDDKIRFRERIGGLIDLIPDAPNRTIRITVRLIDVDGEYYEIQSAILKMVQFPTYPTDFSIDATVSNKKVGESPFGRILIRTIAPEALRGLNFYIYRTDQIPATSDYNATFQKDVDFTCRGFDCSFDYEITDWVFPAADEYKLTVSALLTTQAEDTNSLLTSVTRVFLVQVRVFETAKILETVERSLHTYSSVEEIALVLMLRDEDYANLKGDLRIKFEPYTCDTNAAANCSSLDVNYSPDSYLYDARLGYNYYFFKEMIVDSSGALLADQNFLRMVAHVEDLKNKHASTIHPILTKKCLNDDFSADYFSNVLQFLTGVCATDSSEIVSLTENSGEELMLDINRFYARSPPTQECFFCLNADQNNVYRDELEQELLCGAWYSFDEMPVDRFDFYITNEYSDLSKENNNAQYLKFSLPYELVVYNDLTLMLAALRADGTQINTIGDLVFHGINEVFTGIANPLVDIPEELTEAGIITNLGVDCNFSKALETTNIDGMIFYKVKGLKVINQQDLLQSNASLASVDPADLREYLNYIEDPLDVETSTIEVYGSDFIKLYEKEIESPLVINTPYSETAIRKENIDNDNQYETIPTKLKFDMIHDLLYNNERGNIRRFVPITITAIIQQGGVFNWLGALFGGTGALVTNPVLFLVGNWFGIFLAFIVVLFIAIVFNKVKR